MFIRTALCRRFRNNFQRVTHCNQAITKLPMSTSTRIASKLVRFEDENGTVLCGQFASDQTRVELVEGNDPFGSRQLTGSFATPRKLLAPIVPSQIICIGLNYRKHADETSMPYPKYPIVFMKGRNTLSETLSAIRIPKIASTPSEVDFEGELAVVLKQSCKDITPDRALDYVLGYTVANDVSSRKWQGKKGGSQWCFSKSFDTFCPLGPVLVAQEMILDPQKLRLTTLLNGKTMQDSNTADMIFSVAELISFLSQDTTLPQGTVILTGTPEGVGFTRDPPVYLQPGDKVSITIDCIGTLENHVQST